MRPSRLWRAPAVQALLIQLLALLPLAALAIVLDTAGRGLTLLTAALLQGGLALLITWRLGLAPWWRPIQLLFPVGVLAASALGLPPVLYLLPFLFLLALYWSTFRTQVPYYPSHAAVWRAVAAELPPGRALKLVDIGSGLGGMTLHLARARPDCDCLGIELAPLPWLVARLRAVLSGSRARFVRGDYERLDFAHFDMVFAYLSPAAMPALWKKAKTEMRQGSLLISYEFEIPYCEADKTIVTTEGGPPLFVWVI
ncbi:class I SAM-dependent methyltransferase [Massilia sp. erpn]|uniref:class I SAM-dependent methyltransferase n=1 Tax=Massilia sp. erpn TaxID=2738142 RepID=UPI00220B3DC4|nr:class I SAM-dependent methyltransferase [Massilia sp. erpn]